MKRFAFLLALCSMLFVACDKEQEPIETPDTIAVESVVVTPASCELTVDGEATSDVTAESYVHVQQTQVSINLVINGITYTGNSDGFSY